MPRPQYLRMVDAKRSPELALQHAPISGHAAADRTCQVTLTVQVTCGGTDTEAWGSRASTGEAPRATELLTSSRKLRATWLRDVYPGCVRGRFKACNVFHPRHRQFLSRPPRSHVPAENQEPWRKTHSTHSRQGKDSLFHLQTAQLCQERRFSPLLLQPPQRSFLISWGREVPCCCNPALWGRAAQPAQARKDGGFPTKCNRAEINWFQEV